MDVHNAALDDLPRGYLASPDAESQPPELLSLVFAVGGRGMDLLLVLAPIVVSVVIALSRSETTRWLLYLVYCWWLVRKYGPEALNNAALMARAFPSRSKNQPPRALGRKPPQKPD
jgi:hypothetical protein